MNDKFNKIMKEQIKNLNCDTILQVTHNNELILKKDFDYYMGLQYTEEFETSPEGEFVAKIKELPGCVTQGKTLEEVKTMLHDAKAGWIAIALEDGDTIPEPAPTITFAI